MAFTFGFYNSLNHDRRYNAIQMGQIFDGIIRDGVYSTIGNHFVVRASGAAGSLIVGSGRAWFNYTWNYNDSDMVLQIPQSDILLNRIDAVVLDIYSSEAKRTNSIKWVVGTPSSSPNKPTLIKQLGHYQYPLAYVLRRPNSETVSQSDITNTIGTSECPFVTGILQQVSIDSLLLQWQAQWETLFENLQVLLEGNVAVNLANAILELQNKFNILATEYSVYHSIDDQNGNAIVDEYGSTIDGSIIFELKGGCNRCE